MLCFDVVIHRKFRQYIFANDLSSGMVSKVVRYLFTDICNADNDIRPIHICYYQLVVHF